MEEELIKQKNVLCDLEIKPGLYCISSFQFVSLILGTYAQSYFAFLKEIDIDSS